jgi:hypothetical protein
VSLPSEFLRASMAAIAVSEKSRMLNAGRTSSGSSKRIIKNAGRFTRGLGMARTGNLAGDAHLQLAQDAKADAMIRKSLATADRGDRPINSVNFTAKAAIPARYVLERADWASAACSKAKGGRRTAPDVCFTEIPYSGSLRCWVDVPGMRLDA